MSGMRNRGKGKNAVRQSRQRRRDDDEDAEEIGWTTKAKYSLGFLILMSVGVLQMIPNLGKISRLWSYEFERIDPFDTAKLKEVFFGGQPYLLMCNNATARVPSHFAKVTDYAADIEAFNSAMLDCYHPLPSGDNTYERFKLTKPPIGKDGKIPPSMHIFVNGGRPMDVPVGWSSPNVAPEKLVKFIQSKTKVKMQLVGNSAKLKQHCFKHPYCALVLSRGNRLTLDEEEATQTLMEEFRNVRFVNMNMKKYELSIEKSLPEVEDGDPFPRMIFFKRNKKYVSEEPEADAENDAEEPAGDSDGDENDEDESPTNTKREKVLTVSAKVHRQKYSLPLLHDFLGSMLGGDQKMLELPRLPQIRKRSRQSKRSSKDKKKKSRKGKPAGVKRPKDTPKVDPEAYLDDEDVESVLDDDVKSSSSSSSSSKAERQAYKRMQRDAKKAQRKAAQEEQARQEKEQLRRQREQKRRAEMEQEAAKHNVEAAAEPEPAASTAEAVTGGAADILGRSDAGEDDDDDVILLDD